MKKSGIFVASITAAAAASSSSSKVRISTRKDENMKKKEEENSSKKMGEQKPSDKFAPKFDGLRFIETLVTAHR
ncbi:hypothetical protein P3S67_020660 [Capsicum chacoense]